MAIKDIIGLSQPLTKLIETLDAWGYRIYEPFHIKRIAYAEAEREKIIADAKIDKINKITKAFEENNSILIKYADKDTSISNEFILKNTQKRIITQEISRTINIDNIVCKVIEELKNEKEVSKEPVNKDWITRFFNISQDISDEYLQELWAKILAGEIKQPNSFSLRTLDTLKNISYKEAKDFEKIAKLLFSSINYYFLHKNIDLLSKYGVKFVDILNISHAGLITLQDNIGLKCGEDFKIINKNLILIGNLKNPNLHDSIIEFFILTETGKELLKLINDTCSNDNFFIECAKDIVKKHTQFNFKLHKIISVDEESNGVKYKYDINLLDDTNI